MSKTAIEVITSVQRRRRWSAEEKERLVAASLEPGIGCPRWLAKLGFIQANCMGGDGSFAHVRVQNLSQCAGRPATSSRCKSDTMKE
jgi:transposase